MSTLPSSSLGCTRLLLLSAVLAVISCGDPEEGSPGSDAPGTNPDAELPLIGGGVDVPQDTPSEPDIVEDTGPVAPTCGSAVGTLPEGLTEVFYDDGSVATSVTEQLQMEVIGESLGLDPVNQAVRFDLEHPAKIHGIKMRFYDLPEDPDFPVKVSLRPDMGLNGFDFWPHDVYWEGDQCNSDILRDQWVTFVIDPPIELEHPLPIFAVLARENGEGDPAWSMDTSPPVGCADPSNCCWGYSTCHSTHNWSQLVAFVADNTQHYFWPGLSISFSYDYMVRLLVDYTDDVTEEEHIFHAVEEVEFGGRQAWADYNGDGWEDILVAGNLLYRNDQGTFVDATEESGLAAFEVVASGGIWGDYDNDGCLDLLIYVESYDHGDRLFRNQCDGTFEEVTLAAGLHDEQTYNPCDAGTGPRLHAATSTAAWVDVDGDGFLDLYMGNEICWDTMETYADTLWHNEGDGTFTDWTGIHGFLGPDDERLGTRGVNPVDYDRDGDVDIFVNNYHLHRNFMFRNLGDGEVEEVAFEVGVAGDTSGPFVNPYMGFPYATTYGHSVGSAWGDLDNDGDFDLIVANLAHPRFYDFSDKTQVYIQDEDGNFADTQGNWAYPWGDAGVRYSEGHFSPVLGDIDQDGSLDLAISTAYFGRATDFYWGQGDGTFVLDTYHAGIVLDGGLCMTVGDMDNDGDLDITSNGPLWSNDMKNKGSWLQVRVVGNVDANRAGIGSTVRVHAGDSAWLRHVTGGSGYGCQNSIITHFGLGALESIDQVLVDFPGGKTVIYDGPYDTNQRLWVYEDGTVSPGWTGSGQ